MTLKTVNNLGSFIAKLGIGCVVCLLLGFGILLHAQDKTKAEFIGTKPEIDTAEMKEIGAAKLKAMAEAKEQPRAQSNRFRGRQNRGRADVDFGENEAFYKTIIDNNLFRPLGWTPPNNEPAYSLVGTAVDANGVISQATLLEKRSNRYHFVTIGTKLGDATVKDIQAKQVTLDKAGEPITLKAGALQFLTTSRGREGGRDEGSSEKEENNKDQANAQNRARAEQAKREAGEWRAMNKEMIEKLKAASEEERREIMQKMREERGRGGRRGRGRDR